MLNYISLLFFNCLVVTNFLFCTKFEFYKAIDYMTIHEWSLNVTFQWVDLGMKYYYSLTQSSCLLAEHTFIISILISHDRSGYYR